MKTRIPRNGNPFHDENTLALVQKSDINVFIGESDSSLTDTYLFRNPEKLDSINKLSITAPHKLIPSSVIGSRNGF